MESYLHMVGRQTLLDQGQKSKQESGRYVLRCIMLQQHVYT